MRFNLKIDWKKIGKALKKASPIIFGVAGAAGTVAVAIVAAKDGAKAKEVLTEAENANGRPLTKSEKFKVAGPCYIRTGIVTGATVGLDVASVLLNESQKKALVAPAAAMVTKWLEGKQKDIPEGQTKEALTTSGVDPYEELLIHDPYTDQWFVSTWFTVCMAEMSMNHRFNVGGSYENYAYILSYQDLLNEYKEYDYENELQDFALMPDGKSTEEWGWSIDALWDEYDTGWLGIVPCREVDKDGNEHYELRFNMEPRPFDDLMARD